MVSIKTYKGGLWILFISLYTSANLFLANDKKTKITRKLFSNPPKGDGQTSSPNQVRPSQISEQSMGMSIRHQLISLIMFINFCKWIIVCNICRVIEIARGKFALLARLWHRKSRIYGFESNMKHVDIIPHYLSDHSH